MYEVITDITNAAGAGKVSVMYFDEGATTALLAITTTNLFWDKARAMCSTTTSFRVRSVGRTVDEATGSLTGFYSEVGFGPLAGTKAENPVPDVAQALIRWRTGVVVAGREVRGRTFIPGVAQGQTSGGNLFDGAVNGFNVAAAELADIDTGFGVWHRPKAGSPGVHVAAVNYDTWRELASLRRRRG